MTPADFYESEQDLRDELAHIATEAGWLVEVELPIRVGGWRWGRADIFAYPKLGNTRGKPWLIECKHRIASTGKLRRAVEQCYAYSMLLGAACEAVVTAADLATEVPDEAIRDAFGLTVMAAPDLADELRHPEQYTHGSLASEAVVLDGWEDRHFYRTG